MSVREKLIAARALIDTEDKWTQHVYTTTDGRICASKALQHVGVHVFSGPYKALAEAMGRKWVCDFNDTHTHEEVLAAFDQAIANG